MTNLIRVHLQILCFHELKITKKKIPFETILNTSHLIYLWCEQFYQPINHLDIFIFLSIVFWFLQFNYETNQNKVNINQLFNMVLQYRKSHYQILIVNRDWFFVLWTVSTNKSSIQTYYLFPYKWTVFIMIFKLMCIIFWVNVGKYM